MIRNPFCSRQWMHILPGMALSLLLTLFLGGCIHMNLQSKEYRFNPMDRQETLAIFLPGRGGSMLDLEREGILDILRERKLPLDILSVDAGLWFYMTRTLLQHMETDIVPKVRQDHYREVWLMGNSMGGLGSLLYAREQKMKIKGIILLAPFLGDRPIIEEIKGVGGLLQWTPRETVSENYQRDVWVYLKACVQDQTGDYPQLFLLAGKDDRFHESHRLLAAALKDKHVFWAEGGHDWSAWRTAFRAFANQDRAVTIFSVP